MDDKPTQWQPVEPTTPDYIYPYGDEIGIPPPPPPRKPHRSFVLIGMVLVIVLLLFGASVLYYYAREYPGHAIAPTPVVRLVLETPTAQPTAHPYTA